MSFLKGFEIIDWIKFYEQFINWSTVQFVEYTQFLTVFSLSFNMNSKYLKKLKFNENVDVMVNFERYLGRNYILVPKTSDDYVNNKSIDRKCMTFKSLLNKLQAVAIICSLVGYLNQGSRAKAYGFW